MRSFTQHLTLSLLFITSISFAQRGIDGNKTINTANTIVNEYTTLTADAAAGATTISVAASGLNANTRFGAGNNLAAGDLIMIIQMQGATILGQPDAFTPAISNPNDPTWGDITNYNNTGKFEFCEVKAVPNSTSITVDCGLTNSYTSAGRTQVIRIPRYNTLLISSPGVLTCQSWNGSTGGVVSVEVAGNTTITAGGKINATGTGFRGGALFTTTGRTTTGLYSCASLDVGTNKGESIAGYDIDYTPYGGKFCRAAPANAGGGGNVWNCGGGGGANAGQTPTWTGQGNPDNSVAGYSTAWNLESPSFSASVSSGGGRGGYSFSNSDQNATILGPGTIGVTNAWGGSFRYNLGGLGGRPLDYTTGKIFLGGGGGAGEEDNNQGGAGGAGGGIIYISSYGKITGSGSDSIISNGNNGGSTLITGANAGKDAGGGAGGGGAIIINSVGLVSGVFVKANGGTGGNQLKNVTLPFPIPLNEAEGPGGGGGGGYIGVTNGPAAASQIAAGGSNGISQSPHVTEFLPNGATKGGTGLTNQSVTRIDTISASNVTICSGSTATLTATLNGTISATITWYNSQTGGSVLGTGTTFTTPVLSSTTTYYAGFCPGTYRIPVIVTVNPAPTVAAAGSNQTVCSTSATFAANTPVTGTGSWSVVSGSGTITTPSSPTSTVTSLGAGPNVFQWTISTGAPCTPSTSTVTITNTGGPTTAAAGSNQTVCGTTATLAGNTPSTGTGLWTLVSGAGTITTPSSPTSGITALGVGPNVFQWTISNAPCPASTSTVTITGVTPPTTAAAGSNQTVCGTTATLAGNTPTTGTGTWTLVSGTGTITTPSSPTSGITALGAGPNVFQWTISNAPCTASTSTVTITGVTAPTTASAGSSQTICSSSATFAGNTPTVGTGLWTLVSGAGTITTPSSPTSTVTGLGVGANVFQWTISNAPCTPSTSIVTITNTGGPTTAAAGSNQTVCGTTATLAGNTPTTGTGLWTLVSGAGTITTPSSPTSGVTALGAGPNVFQWTISNAPCPASTSTVTITGVTPPTTAAAGSNQTVCGTTATLAGNTPTTGTGTWTLVSGTGTITTPSSPTSGVTALGAGPNVFQWTISNAPCTASTSTVTITGVTPPTTAAAGTNQTICGTTATLAGNTPATGTGLWTLISGTGTITTPSSPNSTVTGLGTGTNIFQWTISNAPCTASTSNVTINASPAADPTITPLSALCVSAPPITLSAASPGGTWSGTGIINAATGAFDPATAGIGAHSIIYTIPGTCGGADTITININATSDATITQPPSVCVGAIPFNLSAATAGGTWTGTGITSGAAGTFDPATAGIGSHIITYTISGSCGAVDTVVVDVTTLSDATISAQVPLCIGATPITLNDATPGGVWSGTGITNPSTGTFSPAAAGVGTHVITYTISGSCGNMDTMSVTVTPPANANITAVSPVCASASPFNLTAATAGGTWSGAGITNAVSGTFDPSLATPGANTITYSIGGACGDTATQTVTVNALPTPNFTSNITSGCSSVCATFNESPGTSCDSVFFDFGDGNTSTSSSPTNCYTTSGVYSSYSVSISCTDLNHCTGTTTINNMITVYSAPVANMTIDPAGVVPVNTPVSLTDVSANGGNSFWNFGDPTSIGNTASLSTTSHIYTAEGTYCIELISNNTNGCADTTRDCIEVANDATFSIPNVFTPNNDGTNDLFVITSTSVKQLNCSIYDRWGLKIAEWNTVNGSWDGRTTSGGVAPDGVYYYIMKATAMNDKLIEKEGFVQLLKEK